MRGKSPVNFSGNTLLNVISLFLCSLACFVWFGRLTPITTGFAYTRVG